MRQGGDWDEKVRPVYVAVSQAHEVKAKVVGGQPTVGGLTCDAQGWAVLEMVGGGEVMAQLEDRVAVVSIVCLL